MLLYSLSSFPEIYFKFLFFFSFANIFFLFIRILFSFFFNSHFWPSVPLPPTFLRITLAPSFLSSLPFPPPLFSSLLLSPTWSYLRGADCGSRVPLRPVQNFQQRREVKHISNYQRHYLSPDIRTGRRSRRRRRRRRRCCFSFFIPEAEKLFL